MEKNYEKNNEEKKKKTEEEEGVDGQGGRDAKG